jgi:hypothetical protein
MATSVRGPSDSVMYRPCEVTLIEMDRVKPNLLLRQNRVKGFWYFPDTITYTKVKS